MCLCSGAPHPAWPRPFVYRLSLWIFLWFFPSLCFLQVSGLQLIKKVLLIQSCSLSHTSDTSPNKSPLSYKNCQCSFLEDPIYQLDRFLPALKTLSVGILQLLCFMERRKMAEAADSNPQLFGAYVHCFFWFYPFPPFPFWHISKYFWAKFQMAIVLVWLKLAQKHTILP